MSVIERYLPEVEEALRQSITGVSQDAEPAYDMMRYFLGWQDEKGNPIDDPKVRGKRWRPVTTLAVADVIAGDHTLALPFAAAIELFHNYTLIHDDIEDHDEYRRHRKTVWAIWGIEQAVNSGSGLYTIAYKVAQSALHPRLAEILPVLTRAWLEVHEGQYLDMSFEKRQDVTEEEYLSMNSLKTGALVRAAAEVGAMAVTEDEELIEKYRQFGLEFGNAYQVFDDINSVWGKSGETGKAEAGDIRKKKKTLPVMYALRHLDNKRQKRLLKLYGKAKITDPDVQEVIQLFDSVGAREFCLGIANKFMEKTLDALDETGVKSQAKKNLVELVQTITKLNN